MAIPQSELDALWDFSDPSGSEARLRAAAGTETDAATRAELVTQVARALGLQERFAEGHAELDAVASDAPVVGVRIALERGRLRNSGGDAEGAVAFFEDAARKAASVGHTFLQVDALHMIAIAAPDRAADATTEALAVLDRVDDPRTLRWRVALHNNAGWTHFDAGRFAEAITAFQHARDAAERWGTPQQVQWADEALAEARAEQG
ncbi:hypothetical protein [Microbacterium sp.]|uniref:hypothetical protein n=1 Tax=Microbacterium sp. TaxID=51671 RepID=UPI003F71911E